MPHSNDDFWCDVSRLLVEQHRFSSQAAQGQIEKYRATIQPGGVEDALAHFGPERFATAIQERETKDLETAARAARLKFPILIKRLSADDLGEAGGRQRRSIYIPEDLSSFFPRLKGTKNPSASITVRFREFPSPVSLRVVYYRPEKSDRRLTLVPTRVTKNAHSGDFFLLRKETAHDFDGAVVRRGEPQYTRIANDMADRTGMVTRAAYPVVF
jgi:hypothetical protein